MAILKAIRDAFGGAAPPTPPNVPKNFWPIAAKLSYREVSVDPDGHYTFFITPESEKFMAQAVGIEVDHLSHIVKRCLKKCQELGFWHRDPVHFLFNVREDNHEVSWTTPKVVPPMQLSGKTVERSIAAFLPTVRADIEETKRNMMWVAHVKGWLGRESNEPRLASITAAAVKARHKAIFAHEVVHLFATDEYKPIFQILGLKKLELLTDSVVMAAYYRDYKDEGFFVKAGFLDGLGYMVEHLRAMRPSVVKPPEVFELANNQAKAVITECTMLLKEGSADGSKGKSR